jgi:ABC-type transporter Mla MlaB component
LFSLFRKHDNGPADDPEALRLQREQDALDAARLIANSETERLRQREIARATTMKIDAIEAAMASDIFNTPEPAWGSGPRRPARAPAAAAGTAPPTLPLLDQPTTELLSEEELPEAAVAAQTAPVVEEIAILYANGQLAVAEQMLVASLTDAGLNDRTVWWMLFDLFQLTGQQERFDDLAIDYASKFETSPPSWTDMRPPEGEALAYSGVTPTQAFAGTLDAGIGPQLERLLQLAETSPVLRLELNRIVAVEPAGCALLLHALQTLQARERELIVVAAAELAALIRTVVAVGQRNDTEACWLLLLELLQLLNREKEFEETSMDYCVTFEVSPPPFVATQKVATASRQYASASSDRFMLPAVIEGDTAPLFEAIDAYAAAYDTLVFDCSRLARIDFAAAASWQGRLATLAAGGKKVECRDINHLVAALLRLLAFGDIARIFPHKY